MIRKRLTIALVFTAMLTFPALAEDTTQWANLRELRQGQRIGIVQSDRKRVEGRFESFTESSILLRADREIAVSKKTSSASIGARAPAAAFAH